MSSLASEFPGKWTLRGERSPPLPGLRVELARQIEQGNKSCRGEKAAGSGLKGLGHVSTKQEPREYFSPQRLMGRYP